MMLLNTTEFCVYDKSEVNLFCFVLDFSFVAKNTWNLKRVTFEFEIVFLFWLATFHIRNMILGPSFFRVDSAKDLNTPQSCYIY